MKKALVLAAALALLPLPAMSQGMSHSDDRDSSDHRKDRDVEGVLRELGVGTRGGGGGRGASFFLRNGDSTVAVRCDPGDSMRACVDATLTLLEKARAAAPQAGSTPPGTTPPAR
ncbi:MAG TPA: hypothetical protein VI251_17995 [Pseudolabrys sp.]